MVGCKSKNNITVGLSCTTKPKAGSTTLENLINEYLFLYKQAKQAECRQFAELTNIKAVLSKIGEAKNIHGKMYSHQCRLGFALMKQLAESLKKIAGEIDEANSFIKLYTLLQGHIKAQKAEGRFHGIGELCLYDIAFRISAYLECLPEQVFVQSGSKEGAQKWGLKIIQGRVDMQQLPAILLERLEPYEIEDFLCIFKDKLEGLPG